MTLAEKAAQMTCVWQQKATKLLDAEGNFDLAKARENFGHGNGLGQVGRPSDAGGGKNARADGRAHQRDSEVLRRREPAGHSGGLSRRVPARSGGGRRDELFAADRVGGDVRSGPGRAAVHDDGGRGPLARHASGAHAGGRRGPRSALGPRRGNLRRGSVSGRAAGRRGGAGLSGRRHVPRQASA